MSTNRLVSMLDQTWRNILFTLHWLWTNPWGQLRVNSLLWIGYDCITFLSLLLGHSCPHKHWTLIAATYTKYYLLDNATQSRNKLTCTYDYALNLDNVIQLTIHNNPSRKQFIITMHARYISIILQFICAFVLTRRRWLSARIKEYLIQMTYTSSPIIVVFAKFSFIGHFIFQT